jgi:hypothetical protein
VTFLFPATVRVILGLTVHVAAGTTAAEAGEVALAPAAFDATTVKVYGVPFVRPWMVHVVAVGVLHERPAGVDVTVYPVIASPPLLGALHDTSTLMSPATTVGALGVAGAVPGAMLTAVDAPLVPMTLVATSEMLYDVPSVKPEIVHDSAVVAHDCPPGVRVAV